MAKKQQEYMFVLNSNEDFERVRDREYPKCVVIDVHLTWCGPCTVMAPNFKTMYYSYDDPDKRLEIYTMDSSLIAEPTVLEEMGEIT